MAAKTVTAIVLAGGQGKRMGGHVPKQYMLLGGKPLLYYSLKTFQESAVDQIILVVGTGECEYCKDEIVKAYGFTKVTYVVEGGKERYHSVYEGLKRAGESSTVLIHDGARPFVTEETIDNAIKGAALYGACVASMPSKDTIKLSDESGFARTTPDRRQVYIIQTPQAFQTDLLMDAYTALFREEKKQEGITDDAMVVETMTSHKVKLVEGSYANIKITTPEDLILGEALLKKVMI